MSQFTVDQTLRLAIGHHQAGRLVEAEALYREVLAVQPQRPDALHLLGVIFGQRGLHAQAVESIRKAIALAPGIPDYHCNLGIFLDARGNTDEAMAAYRAALALHADHAEAHNRMGNALAKTGATNQAIACYQRALAINPNLPDVYNNLGNAWKDKGQLDQAIAHFRRALALDANHALTCNNLGAALRESGNPDEAIALCQRALAVNPQLAEALLNEGNAWRDKGKTEQAMGCFQRALELRPGWDEAYFHLGKAWADGGQLEDAIGCFHGALASNPNHLGALNSLGNVWLKKRQFASAIQIYQRALVLSPTFADAYANLGNAFWGVGNLDEAVACCRRALELKPNFVSAIHTLANVLKDRGEMDEAVACYRRGLALEPDAIDLRDNLMYALLFHGESDRASLQAEAQEWSRRHAAPLRAAIRPHENDRDPQRRLRVGYVSPDFRNHPVGRFILPLLAEHDRAQLDVFCYADVALPDEITTRIQSVVPNWRPILRMTHEQAAQQIRADRIDILVDLTMHMGENRMPLFARKPAPVQVTYLAYVGGTGVDAIDYRLTDAHLDPDPAQDRFYLEKSIRLPASYWCYQPIIATPPVNELPALTSGRITFGCLNNFSKVTPATLETWAALLLKVPGSRLLLHVLPGSHRERVRQLFSQRGIATDRLEWIGFLSVADYFHIYQRMDIALDPFPYVGGTTTCDALEMGVPVVTLAGRTGVGRSGVSLLSNVGLPELIAQTPEQYIQIAAALAVDLARLKGLRSTLRDTLAASPLMDARRFARAIENAYRTMWRESCFG